eukprot:CAMPEP_0174739928 /NCGR_PEP_ID=MMETSP1094-20130205/72405_1 /TAXON_ID=156173 /ORGANISM="Chrysochromulina brevifilum, Strain UTEX LB 985" /LENGTH=51 /DNA_ID=CAMNT_0015943549 /DNA_START=214 /DNA_END=369 /DNA_ORIENTATION=-
MTAPVSAAASVLWGASLSGTDDLYTSMPTNGKCISGGQLPSSDDGPPLIVR